MNASEEVEPELASIGVTVEYTALTTTPPQGTLNPKPLDRGSGSTAATACALEGIKPSYSVQGRMAGLGSIGLSPFGTGFRFRLRGR